MILSESLIGLSPLQIIIIVLASLELIRNSPTSGKYCLITTSNVSRFLLFVYILKINYNLFPLTLGCFGPGINSCTKPTVINLASLTWWIYLAIFLVVILILAVLIFLIYRSSLFSRVSNSIKGENNSTSSSCVKLISFSIESK